MVHIEDVTDVTPPEALAVTPLVAALSDAASSPEAPAVTPPVAPRVQPAAMRPPNAAITPPPPPPPNAEIPPPPNAEIPPPPLHFHLHHIHLHNHPPPPPPPHFQPAPPNNNHFQGIESTGITGQEITYISCLVAFLGTAVAVYCIQEHNPEKQVWKTRTYFAADLLLAIAIISAACAAVIAYFLRSKLAVKQVLFGALVFFIMLFVAAFIKIGAGILSVKLS